MIGDDNVDVAESLFVLSCLLLSGLVWRLV